MSDPDWEDVTVTDPARLDEVEAQIHDCPFEPDDVRFDEPARTLTIPFRRYGWDQERRVGGTPIRADYEFPWRRSFLRVLHATAVRIDDRAQVGTSELLGVEYRADPPTVRLHSMPDHEVEVAVDALAVAVEHTGEVLGSGRRQAYLGMIYRADDAVHPS
ncbi:MAG TPA: DUF2948 family protein [Thermoleophilaceae bacterium]|nr:DUF2948 family protein [Thermoleophilaceae bacterium]